MGHNKKFRLKIAGSNLKAEKNFIEGISNGLTL
jgi:hypothetical protein